MKVKSESEVAQSCLNLTNPMDCSPPGSSVRGIFQARVLEWVAIAAWQIEGDNVEVMTDFLLLGSKITGEGNGNPLQCSCLKNPWDEGAWCAALYGVTESQTRLK